jgi:PAS domain S-box-containing protein
MSLSDDGATRPPNVLLASIVESSDDAILSKDMEGRITSWNAAAERLYGYTTQEAIGRPVTMLAPPESDGEIEAIMDRVARGERIEHFETVRMRKDGSRVDVSITVSPIRDGSGTIVGASTIAREIGGRKQTERRMADLVEQLKRANERFELAASAVTAVIYEWDLGGDTVVRSRGLVDVVGFRPEEVSSSETWWDERIHPDDRARVREQMDAALDHAATFAVEYRVLHKNETYVYVSDQGIIVRDAADRPVRIVGSTQNVNERRRAEEDRDRLFVREQHARREAEEASRIKDEFLATISHELRTPLNAILGWARMLGGGLDDATFTRGVDAIQRNALSLTELVNDLLDVSRIISGNLRLDVRAVELPAVVQMAVESVRPSADAKGIRLHVVLDPRAGPVLGDPERLQQVIWNLLSNAIKFTPKGGRVQIQLQRVNSHVEVVVSDTGVGISDEFLPYVFDRFRQADASITRKHGGLGLGLSIVRHLVELHGGVVHAESDGADSGATFTVRLPVMVLRRGPSDPTRVHPAAGGADSLECPPSLANLHVVVVDDEPDTNEILALILEQCEAKVEKCLSAVEALDAFDRGPVDLLISDIGMPRMDGYELIRRVRERPANRGGRVPAIALTAFARVEDRVRVLSAGFQAHVGKPVEPAELLAVVASLAGRSGSDAAAE